MEFVGCEFVGFPIAARLGLGGFAFGTGRVAELVVVDVEDDAEDIVDEIAVQALDEFWECFAGEGVYDIREVPWVVFDGAIIGEKTVADLVEGV